MSSYNKSGHIPNSSRVSSATQTDETARPDEFDDENLYDGHQPYMDGPYDDYPYDDDPYNNDPYRRGPYDEGPSQEASRLEPLSEPRYTFDIQTETVYVDQEPSQEKPTVLTGAKRPSRLAFLCYVYVLIFAQVSLASLQWMANTYLWKPKVYSIERNMNTLLLFLAWLNLSLGFFGFRRLQFTFPLNWIIFACIFESLTLAIMCLSICQLDLTWPFILAGIGVLILYNLLGIWVPRMLTADLWMLIFVSITVLLFSFFTLASSLAMHHFVPITLCLAVFGPWAMYLSQKLHSSKRADFSTFQYLDAASKVYINFAMTVGCVCLMHHQSIYYLDTDECKDKWFCARS